MKRWIFLLTLAACGEDPTYDIRRMHVYGETPSRGELVGYLNTWTDLSGYLNLPRTMEFHSGLLDCPVLSGKCWGLTYLKREHIDVVFKPCIGATAIAHELFHFNLWLETGDPDYEHDRSDLFVTMNAAIAAAVGCRDE